LWRSASWFLSCHHACLQLVSTILAENALARHGKLSAHDTFSFPSAQHYTNCCFILANGNGFVAFCQTVASPCVWRYQSMPAGGRDILPPPPPGAGGGG
jgi:hypothetical protein